MFIANFHAMTTLRVGAALREATKDVALDYLACGLDPEKKQRGRPSETLEFSRLLTFEKPRGRCGARVKGRT